MLDDELRSQIAKAKQRAATIGPQHSLWEVIFDAEALLKGERSLLPRAQIEEILLRANRVSDGRGYPRNAG